MNEASLSALLKNFATFLNSRNLVPKKYYRFFVQWVREFLRFADQHKGETFEQTLDRFLAEVGARPGIQSWKIQQAADAIRIYRFQFRKSLVKPTASTAPATTSVMDHQSILNRFREILRLRHYATRTEKTYLHWAKRFLNYHRQTGPSGQPAQGDVKAFLTRLAMVDKVSASTQNQAFCALLLLFREVFRCELDEIAETVRAKRGPKLPTVLSVDEVKRLLAAMDPKYRLMVELLYGSGIRLMELLRLRIKDIDFDAGLIIIHSGKGDKDRATLLPSSLHDRLQDHLANVRRQHQEDLTNGHGEVFLPFALKRKYPNANREIGWQYVFPAVNPHFSPMFVARPERCRAQ